MSYPILPPGVIGIIGGGQLGMMAVREAQRMGYRTVVWDPSEDCPASRLADETLVASFDDKAAALQMCNRADVVTFEFENVDLEIVRWIEERTPVSPGSDVLRISQNRFVEKSELKSRGFPVVPFARCEDSAELQRAIDRIGPPAVVKTESMGYDGKGQAVLLTSEDVSRFIAGQRRFIVPLVVEKFLELSSEISIMVARNRAGSVVSFPVSRNEHRENILHVSSVPAGLDDTTQAKAVLLAGSLAESLGLVGLLGIEMFVSKDGDLLVNEIAPRPHNSGHYSLDACDINQFEMFIRSVCGLPLPVPQLLTPVTVINLLGKHLVKLDMQKLLNMEGVKLHLYGKSRVEPKRKMGHVTIMNRSLEEMTKQIQLIERMIGEEISESAGPV